MSKSNKFAVLNLVADDDASPPSTRHRRQLKGEGSKPPRVQLAGPAALPIPNQPLPPTGGRKPKRGLKADQAAQPPHQQQPSVGESSSQRAAQAAQQNFAQSRSQQNFAQQQPSVGESSSQRAAQAAQQNFAQGSIEIRLPSIEGPRREVLLGPKNLSKPRNLRPSGNLDLNQWPILNQIAITTMAPVAPPARSSSTPNVITTMAPVATSKPSTSKPPEITDEPSTSKPPEITDADSLLNFYYDKANLDIDLSKETYELRKHTNRLALTPEEIKLDKFYDFQVNFQLGHRSIKGDGSVKKAFLYKVYNNFQQAKDRYVRLTGFNHTFLLQPDGFFCDKLTQKYILSFPIVHCTLSDFVKQMYNHEVIRNEPDSKMLGARKFEHVIVYCLRKLGKCISDFHAEDKVIGGLDYDNVYLKLDPIKGPLSSDYITPQIYLEPVTSDKQGSKQGDWKDLAVLVMEIAKDLDVESDVEIVSLCSKLRDWKIKNYEDLSAEPAVWFYEDRINFLLDMWEPMSDPDLHLFQKGYEREYHFPYSISTWENEFKALLDLVPVRAKYSRSCHSFVSSARGNVRHYKKNDMGDYREKLKDPEVSGQSVGEGIESVHICFRRYHASYPHMILDMIHNSRQNSECKKALDEFLKNLANR